jgi:hypothetical protein
MFSYCIKGPIRYTAYKYFLDNGRWSDENELSAQDRSLDSRNPDLPDPNSFEGLSTRLGIMATEARRIVGLGPASSKPEADRAADLKNTVAMLHKALEVGFEAEKAPINDKLQKCRIKWTPLINDAKDCKDALNIKVITPWLAVERARAEQEALAAKQAQAQAVLDNVPIPTTRRGEAKTELPSAGNFGRKTHTREVWTPEITDRAAFLEHVKDYPAITDALDKIARTFKSTRPEIPGLTYKQTFEAV